MPLIPINLLCPFASAKFLLFCFLNPFPFDHLCTKAHSRARLPSSRLIQVDIISQLLLLSRNIARRILSLSLLDLKRKDLARHYEQFIMLAFNLSSSSSSAFPIQ